MRQSYWFNRSFTTVILTIIAVSCTMQEPVFFIDSYSVNGKYNFHHTARSYGDGADFEQMYSTLKEDILHKTIIKGYYPYVIQSDTLVNSIPTVPETQVIADTTTIQERINTDKHRFQEKIK